MIWQTVTGSTGSGFAEARAATWGDFWFFTDDNVELAIKVLDGRVINGHFWVFAGSLTDLELRITIRDHTSGLERTYEQRAGKPHGFSDTEAFAAPSDSSPANDRIGITERPQRGPAGPGDDFHAACPSTALCLLDRFEITASFRVGDGPEREAVGIPLSKSSAQFWFFEAGNPEIFLKVLDARVITGSFWVFATSLTGLEYELVVTDRATHRQVSYQNAADGYSTAIDLSSFTDSMHPPDKPTIIEPATEGETVSVVDVHMETGSFADADGDQHDCTDFEIWRTPEDATPSERVWSAPCVRGLIKTHIHLGDGTFEGSIVVTGMLGDNKLHQLRVRFRDGSGMWSEWAERGFVTGTILQAFPLRLQQVTGVPGWVRTDGRPLRLPSASPSPELRVESTQGDLLLSFRSGNRVFVPGPLVDSEPVRLKITSGALNKLVLAESEVRLRDQNDEPHTIYLPAMTVSRGSPVVLWVSSNGSTFTVDLDETVPEVKDIARHTPRPWALRQPGFVVEEVAGGLRLPVQVAFPPVANTLPGEPLAYVSELYGSIKVIQRDGEVKDFKTGLLNFDPNGNFPGSGEIGVAGLLVEPNSGDLLVSLVYQLDPNDAAQGFADRVILIESLDGGLRGGTTSVVFDTAPDLTAASHQISTISIGPDGKLYVQVADGLQSAKAQDLHSYLGKIHRLELDGTPAIDNPYYDPSDGIDAADYVFALGFRNPFGGAWRVADGHLYEVENGPSVDRLARVDTGVNYGWDLDANGSGTNDDMRRHAIYNWGPPPHAPVHIAWVQAQTFAGSGFPAAMFDHAFVSEFGPTFLPGPSSSGKRIAEFTIDLEGQLVGEPTTLIEYDGHGRASVVGLAAGPDGLYFTDFFADVTNPPQPIAAGARLWRVRFVGAPD